MNKPHQLYYYCMPLEKTDFAVMMFIPSYEQAADAVANRKQTPLDIFIFENEPAGKFDEERFRAQLQATLDYIFYLGGAPTLRGNLAEKHD